MKIEKVNLQDAYNGAYYTIIGAGGDLQEWVDGYTNLLKEENIGIPKAWYTCSGYAVNKEFELEGHNKFKRNLTFLFFPLDSLNVSKLALFRLRMEDKWFNDLIDNSRRKVV